jgi:DNA-binding Lrp family transcriptional regulator
MRKETNDLQQKPRTNRPLDEFDRRILGAMTENARQTYAEIGDRVGLSAPAVHERVKRLTKSGALSGTSAHIDPGIIGKPFLAFVHVNAHGWGKSERMMSLNDFPEVEEMHSVAGDACVILKVRTESAHAMEQFLAQLYATPGVKSSKSYVVLSTYLERPVQAEVTHDWPDVPPPPEIYP